MFSYQRLAVASMFAIAVVVAGCGERSTSTLPPVNQPAELAARRPSSLRPHVPQPGPWCGVGTGEIPGEPITIFCILDAGQQASATIQVPVDEADAAQTTDSCGPVAWGPIAPSQLVTITIAPSGTANRTAADRIAYLSATHRKSAANPPPSPTTANASSCMRSDSVTVDVQRPRSKGPAAPTPPPGSLLYQYIIPGTDNETEPGETGPQKGSGTEMPGPGGMSSSGIPDLEFAIMVFSPPQLVIEDADNGFNVISRPASPSPLMVGQQINLYPSLGQGASSYFGFASAGAGGPQTLSWDMAPPPNQSEVVGSYSPCPAAVDAAAPCPSVGPALPLPSPIGVGTAGPSGEQTLMYYYLAGGMKMIRVEGEAKLGMSGAPADAPIYPVEADVHYDIGAPNIVKATAVSTAQTNVGWYGQANSGTSLGYSETCDPPYPPATPIPGTVFYSYILSLHAGNQCEPHGIDWTLQVSTPSWGTGVIAVAQVMNTVRSGMINGQNTAVLNQTGLDGNTYPYSDWVPTNQTWTDLDAPEDPLLTTSCTMLTRNDTFTDFFLYQKVPSNRPSIPVTLREYTWKWGGQTTIPTPNPLPSPAPTWQPAAGATNPSPTLVTPMTLPSWTQALEFNTQFGSTETDPCYPTATPTPSPSPAPTCASKRGPYAVTGCG